MWGTRPTHLRRISSNRCNVFNFSLQSGQPKIRSVKTLPEITSWVSAWSMWIPGVLKPCQSMDNLIRDGHFYNIQRTYHFGTIIFALLLLIYFFSIRDCLSSIVSHLLRSCFSHMTFGFDLQLWPSNLMKMQSEIADFPAGAAMWQTRPNNVACRPTGAAIWWNGQNIGDVYDSDPLARLWENMTLSENKK